MYNGTDFDLLIGSIRFWAKNDYICCYFIFFNTSNKNEVVSLSSLPAPFSFLLFELTDCECFLLNIVDKK